jgi:hypothetical protein
MVGRLVLTRALAGIAFAVGATAPAGCGSQRDVQATRAGGHTAPAHAPAPVVKAHPRVLEPNVGDPPLGGGGAGSNAPVVGDVNAHAPSLASVKRELRRLNLCGGATSAADAAPIVKSKHPGFVADPGTIQDVGQLPQLTVQLNSLAQALGVTIYGISGYRSPQHSVAVGGYANDPHTKGEAEDIGVNSLLRSSAAQISEAELARYGLYRPFDPSGDANNTEVNHIQLIPAGGPLTLAAATAAFDPDPTCT